MHYYRGDIVKLDLVVQNPQGSFSLTCPYVTVTSEYTTIQGGTLFAQGNLISMVHDSMGDLLPNAAYFFNPRHSELIVAGADRLRIEGEPIQ